MNTDTLNEAEKQQMLEFALDIAGYCKSHDDCYTCPFCKEVELYESRRDRRVSICLLALPPDGWIETLKEKLRGERDEE